MKSASRRDGASVAEALFAGAALFAVAFGPISFLDGSRVSLSLRSAEIFGLGLILWLGGFAQFERRIPLLSPLTRCLYEKRTFSDAAFAGSCIILGLSLFSDLPWRLHTFLPLPGPSWLLGAVFVVAFALAGRFNTLALLLLLICAALAATAGFLITTHGRLIYTDDHPAFLYRLIQLKENFPDIPFYNPMWNAGVEAREFFPSGALNVFLIFSPIVYLFDLTESYNYILLAILFLLTPGAAFLAGRILGFARREAALAAILSLVASVTWYRWALAYGTVGFTVSAALVPLNLALACRFLDPEPQLNRRTVLLTVVSVTLMALWSPSVLLLLPIGVFALVRLKTLVRNRHAVLTISLLVAVNAPWMTVFYKVSNVGGYITKAQTGGSVQAAVHEESKFKGTDAKTANLPWHTAGIKLLRQNASRVNPLVFFFGLSGLLLLHPRTARSLISSFALWVLLLGTFGPLLKPQLELERMYVVLALVLAAPAALLFSKGLERRGLLSVVPMGLLLLAPVWLWKITTNRTTENYTTAEPEVWTLSEAIREHASGGRTLFAGFILHELSSGHVAPLAAFAQEPLIASSYQHDSWKYRDVIPKEFRKAKEQGVMDFLDLMNVSSVVAHDRFWKKWFRSRPALFRPVWTGGRFTIFRRLDFSSNYFFSGSGRIVEQRSNSVTVEPDSNDVVIKFRYLPFLKAEGCTVLPYEVSPSVTLTRLSGCAKTPVTLKASDIIDRLL